MVEQQAATNPEADWPGVHGEVGAASGTDTGNDKMEAARSAAVDIAGNAKDAAADVKEQAGQQARAVAGEVGDQARQLLDTTRMELKDQAAVRTERLAASIRSLSQQVRAMAEGRPQEAEQLRGLATDAQARLSGWAARLDEGGVDGVVADLGGFARRRPLVFLAGCAGAGFALGRVMRTTRAAGSHGGSEGTRSYGAGNGSPVLGQHGRDQDRAELPEPSLAGSVPTTAPTFGGDQP